MSTFVHSIGFHVYIMIVIFFRFFFTEELFSAQENFCRNINGDDRPWCLTTDPNYRTDYCDVPSCGNINCSSLDRILKQVNR